MSYKYFRHNLIVGKLVLMTDVVAMSVLGDVMPKVCKQYT